MIHLSYERAQARSWSNLPMAGLIFARWSVIELQALLRTLSHISPFYRL